MRCVCGGDSAAGSVSWACRVDVSGGDGEVKVDLLATISIKPLERAPVDDIKGLAADRRCSCLVRREGGRERGRER